MIFPATFDGHNGKGNFLRAKMETLVLSPLKSQQYSFIPQFATTIIVYETRHHNTAHLKFSRNSTEERLSHICGRWCVEQYAVNSSSYTYTWRKERERDSRVPSIVSNDVSYANLSPSSSFLHCSHLLQSQHFDANLESFDVFVVIKVISLQRKRTL